MERAAAGEPIHLLPYHLGKGPLENREKENNHGCHGALGLWAHPFLPSQCSLESRQGLSPLHTQGQPARIPAHTRPSQVGLHCACPAGKPSPMGHLWQTICLPLPQAADPHLLGPLESSLSPFHLLAVSIIWATFGKDLEGGVFSLT